MTIEEIAKYLNNNKPYILEFLTEPDIYKLEGFDLTNKEKHFLLKNKNICEHHYEVINDKVCIIAKTRKKEIILTYQNKI